jgi:RNA polymerase sigma-70 factor (ECF subfamily)
VNTWTLKLASESEYDQAGSSVGFEDIYKEHSASVYRFCVFALRDPHAAEDATADVFTAAYAAYRRTRPDAELLHSWLFRIARNTIIDRQRRSVVFARALIKLGHESKEVRDVEAEVEIREDIAELLDTMSHLNKRDRTLIAMRCGAELSFADIGKALGITEKNAAMATYRAVERLRRERGGSK